MISTPRDAEELAANVMRSSFGFPDAQLVSGGPDGGVDVRSRQALAQVKRKTATTGRPDLQRLYGARGADLSKQLLFFSLAGYSRQAITYANEHGICLFQYDNYGNVSPANPSARRLAPYSVQGVAGVNYRTSGDGWGTVQIVFTAVLVVWVIVAWIMTGNIGSAIGSACCPGALYFLLFLQK
ncbi:restriction endonuclease [Rhodococcus wratislaviensis]|uniref:restriction endonuclease n=1 Tax=Rhodococcus wratislaviensis TaxID=44752 RepID=UPI00365541C8